MSPATLKAVAELTSKLQDVIGLPLDKCPSFDFKEVCQIMPDPCQFIVNLQDGLVEENVQKAKGELEEALVKFETWIENTLSNYGKDVSYIATFADEYCTKLKDASLETLANEQLESM